MTMSEWDRHGLCWDLTELILSKLPLQSMIRASAVCRAWRDVLLAHHHHHHHHRPWLFLHGHNNVVPRLGRTTFAYDPAAPDSWVSFSLPPGCFAGAGGFAFASPSPSRLAFAPLLREGDAAWRHAPTLASSRCSPVVAALPSSSKDDTSSGVFLVVGGARFVGGLVDIEDGRLPTELYHHDVGTSSRWEQCAPLPAEFGSSSSSLCLSSAVVGAGRFFFVYGTYTCTVSAFDLSRRAWTPARELRPAPGLVAAFLASGRGGRRLLLAGVDQGGAGAAFGVWDVDPETLAATKIGEMPPELRELMMSNSQEDVAVRCVGEDGLLYVVSDEQHRAYPACACEVVGDGDGASDRLWCRWSKLPPLPVAGTSAASTRWWPSARRCSSGTTLSASVSWLVLVSWIRDFHFHGTCTVAAAKTEELQQKSATRLEKEQT